MLVIITIVVWFAMLRDSSQQCGFVVTVLKTWAINECELISSTVMVCREGYTLYYFFKIEWKDFAGDFWISILLVTSAAVSCSPRQTSPCQMIE